MDGGELQLQSGAVVQGILKGPMRVFVWRQREELGLKLLPLLVLGTLLACQKGETADEARYRCKRDALAAKEYSDQKELELLCLKAAPPIQAERADAIKAFEMAHKRPALLRVGDGVEIANSIAELAGWNCRDANWYVDGRAGPGEVFHDCAADEGKEQNCRVWFKGQKLVAFEALDGEASACSEIADSEFNR